MRILPLKRPTHRTRLLPWTLAVLAACTAAGIFVSTASAATDPASLAAAEVHPVVPRASLPLDLKAVARLETPEIDRELLAAEDEIREASGAPYRFAVPHPVLVNPSTHGIWQRLDEETLVWRLLVHAPGATSVSLGFERFFMPPGGRLVLYAADESAFLRPFTARDNQAHGELWTPILPVDEIILELTVPEAEKGQLELLLTSVNHGYRGFGAAAGNTGEKSGSCNVDVACPEANSWRNQVNSVARIVIGGGILCTGGMLNNTAGDLRPYFLTAFHCGATPANASSVVVYWNYENSTCRTPGSASSGQSGNGNLNRFQSGSVYRAGYEPSDFALLELNSQPNPNWNVFWAGWDRSGAAPGNAVAIHHPSGDEKRISFENDPLAITSYLGNSSPGNGTHLRVQDWDLGTTEGGSSGSPLFNPQRRVIGQLEGGFAACGNNDSDWYGRLAVSWNGGGSNASRLSNWLAPVAPGTTTLDGRGQSTTSPPAAPSNLTAQTISASEIRLDWQDNSSDEADFLIQASLDGVNFVNAGTVPPDTTAAVVASLQPGTQYFFRLRARNASGNSGFSNVATATTLSDTIERPTQATAEALSSSQIRVRWRDNSSGETDFQIQISQDGVTFTNAGTAPANATTFVASGLQSLTEYFFRVRARANGTSSPFSNVASATTNSSPGNCTPNAQTLCLTGGRFRVTAVFQAPGEQLMAARAQTLTQDTGYFWFFNAANVEVIVKTLRACTVNNHYWVFAAGLTNVLTRITVVDTATGAAQTYTNPQGTAFQPIQDAGAFETCP